MKNHKPSTIVMNEFVEFMPDILEENTLYVSMKFATAVHKCFCGCGSEVVTPISRAGWQLWFDGQNISLSPSIGSWGLACQSHYFVRNGQVVWAPKWSRNQVKEGRAADRRLQLEHFGEIQAPKVQARPLVKPEVKKRPWWRVFF